MITLECTPVRHTSRLLEQIAAGPSAHYSLEHAEPSAYGELQLPAARRHFAPRQTVTLQQVPVRPACLPHPSKYVLISAHCFRTHKAASKSEGREGLVCTANTRHRVFTCVGRCSSGLCSDSSGQQR